METVEDTKKFVKNIIKEEKDGKTVSRVIFDENDDVIGITTLMFIDYEKKSCHIGTWIGYEYWGKGYNQASKIEILRIALEKKEKQACVLHAFYREDFINFLKKNQ
jgi:RimJ/RimL family protein N-acetyltransferase